MKSKFVREILFPPKTHDTKKAHNWNDPRCELNSHGRGYPLNYKVYRTMTTSGCPGCPVCRGTPYFRRCNRELLWKPAISLKKSWGATLERLPPPRKCLVALLLQNVHLRFWYIIVAASSYSILAAHVVIDCHPTIKMFVQIIVW